MIQGCLSENKSVILQSKPCLFRISLSEVSLPKFRDLAYAPSIAKCRGFFIPIVT